MQRLHSGQTRPRIGVRIDSTAPTRGDATVTIDKSLRRKGHLLRSRNVLKRSERIENLEFEDRWVEGQSPFGLPKVRVIKSTLGRKKKKKKEEEEELGDETMDVTEPTEEDE